jgi:hypothetical protein
MKRVQRLLRESLRAGAGGLLVVVVVAAALWGTLALWFALLAEAGARLMVAVLFAGLGIGGLVMALRRQRMFLALLPFTIALMVLLLWWSTIEPSNDRAWQPDVARLPSAEIDGDFITLRKIRSFDYRSAADYTEHWYDRTFDLRRLDAVDLIAVYWAGDAIAHIIVSFGFAGEHVAISIETRKERGETYSSIAGFFKRYELIYVVGDERDLIRVRTNYRRPEELVYLYRTRARPKSARRLFLEYVERINRLREQPEFYNTLTTNCTTDVWLIVRALSGRFPLDWRVLLSGYFPEYLYDLGSLDTRLPFPELKARSLINDKAYAADQAVDFSRRIREGLPRPPRRSASEPSVPRLPVSEPGYARMQSG